MPFIASMGIYVISKNAMLDLLREKFPGANDFGSEVIPGATSIGMRVCSPFGCLTLRTLFRLFLRDVIPKNIVMQGKFMSYYSFVLRVFNV
jgi:ADP-glucose pyrophosphorylase